MKCHLRACPCQSKDFPMDFDPDEENVIWYCSKACSLEIWLPRHKHEA